MISDRHDRKQGTALLLLVAAAAVVAGMMTAGASAADKDERIPYPKPGSHRGNWSEYHGRSVGAGGGSAGRPPAACLVCHERRDCITCHTMIMPRDHTNFWRTRGHGLMAEGNRERCLACHRQDYCIRCHSETAPRTHTASWRQRHCTQCHYGSGGSVAGNCTVCHKRAMHASAPHPINPGMNCALCHV
jgi:hypothetical protein